MKLMPQTERRFHRRVPLHIPAQLYHAGTRSYVRVLNVSKGGVFVKHFDVYVLGQEVVMDIHFERSTILLDNIEIPKNLIENLGTLINVRAITRWIEPNSEGAGLQFIDFEPSKQAALDALVKFVDSHLPPNWDAI